MKNIIWVLIVGLSVTAFGFGQDGSKVTIEDLGWMSGCWKKKGKTEDSFTMEHWTRPAGTMLGLNRRVKNGRVEFFEYLRVEVSDGNISYVARPMGAKVETPFKLTSLRNNEAVFENPVHVFPQRIVFLVTDIVTFAVRVEADKKGKTSGFGFSMKKQSCDQN